MYAYLFARYHPSETYTCAFRVTSTNSHTNSQSSVRWHKAKKNPFIVDFKKSLIKIRSYAFTVFDSDRRQRARCHGKAPAIRLTRKSYRKFTKVVRLVVNFLTFTVSMIWILLHALLSAFCSKHFLLLNLCFLHSYLPVTAGNIFVFVWMRMNEIDAAQVQLEIYCYQLFTGQQNLQRAELVEQNHILKILLYSLVYDVIIRYLW